MFLLHDDNGCSFYRTTLYRARFCCGKSSVCDVGTYPGHNGFDDCMQISLRSSLPGGKDASVCSKGIIREISGGIARGGHCMVTGFIADVNTQHHN